jgi:hypothetical protein
MKVSEQVPHRTAYGPNNSWVVPEIPVKWLPVLCETNRPARAIGTDCWACARNFFLSSAVASAEYPGSKSLAPFLRGFPTATRERRVCWEADFQRQSDSAYAFWSRNIFMQWWNTSVIRLKWMCFVGGPFAKPMDQVTRINYVDVLQLCLMPQLQEDRDQIDRATTHIWPKLLR